MRRAASLSWRLRASAAAALAAGAPVLLPVLLAVLTAALIAAVLAAGAALVALAGLGRLTPRLDPAAVPADRKSVV